MYIMAISIYYMYVCHFIQHVSMHMCIITIVILKTGVPDPPSSISLSLEGNCLRSSWDCEKIPTVNVTSCWSLSFFGPSQLSNIITTLLTTNTYNYTLRGARSCDPFRLCIRAKNEVGNSSCSWINNTLPYLPQHEYIEYSLFQVNNTFSLNVTVMVKTKLLHFTSRVMLHFIVTGTSRMSIFHEYLLS